VALPPMLNPRLVQRLQDAKPEAADSQERRRGGALTVLTETTDLLELLAGMRAASRHR